MQLYTMGAFAKRGGWQVKKSYKCGEIQGQVKSMLRRLRRVKTVLILVHVILVHWKTGRTIPSIFDCWQSI